MAERKWKVSPEARKALLAYLSENKARIEKDLRAPPPKYPNLTKNLSGEVRMATKDLVDEILMNPEVTQRLMIFANRDSQPGAPRESIPSASEKVLNPEMVITGLEFLDKKCRHWPFC